MPPPADPGNGFRGLGDEGLWLLERAGHAAGIPTVTEVVDSKDLDSAAAHVDMLEIGPDTMQHFSLLRDVGKVGKPVLLHRGPSATIDEWLMAAEYVLNEGNEAVVLCERGSRGFDPRTSDTLDIGAVPVVQRLSHLPVVVDPAPVRDGADLITPLALAGRSVGADGLVVLVHPDPERAIAGNGSQLDMAAFGELMERLGIPSLRDEIDRIDRELVRLVARRLRSSVEIARIKAQKRIPLRSPERETELIAEVAADAASQGVDPAFAAELMTLVLDHSRLAQRSALEHDHGAPSGDGGAGVGGRATMALPGAGGGRRPRTTSSTTTPSGGSRWRTTAGCSRSCVSRVSNPVSAGSPSCANATTSAACSTGSTRSGWR